jgi:tetratricopeptide (TPR) repeat protein
VILYYTSFYERRADFEEAERLFISSEKVCPPALLNENKAQFYIDWAESEAQASKLKEAAEHLEKAYSLIGAPSQSESLRPLQTTSALKTQISLKLSDIYSRLAVLAQLQNKNDQEAISYLEKSLMINDLPSTRMILANIYKENKIYDKAIDNYQRVAQADKNNLESRHHLIELLLETKDIDRAQKALVELCDKEKSVENYQQLADADIKLNNYAGAVHALEDASDLGRKPDVLKQLLAVLNDWYASLIKEKKITEANSVKGHADRVAELLETVEKEEAASEQQKQLKSNSNKLPPVALISSRTWLVRGSVTPEGEIKIKNVSGRPVSDLTLSAVFYDNTARRANGGVTLPVAVPNSSPFAANDERTLYFSCPTIVKADHKLAVLIFWKGVFLQEFPVVKQ